MDREAWLATVRGCHPPGFSIHGAAKESDATNTLFPMWASGLKWTQVSFSAAQHLNHPPPSFFPFPLTREEFLAIWVLVRRQGQKGQTLAAPCLPTSISIQPDNSGSLGTSEAALCWLQPLLASTSGVSGWWVRGASSSHGNEISDRMVLWWVCGDDPATCGFSPCSSLILQPSPWVIFQTTYPLTPFFWTSVIRDASCS